MFLNAISLSILSILCAILKSIALLYEKTAAKPDFSLTEQIYNSGLSCLEKIHTLIEIPVNSSARQ
jgi:hypothetical protein